MTDQTPFRRTRSTGRFEGAVPEGLIAHCADHIRPFDADLSVTETGLDVDFGESQVALRCDGDGFSVTLTARDELGLHQVRQSVLFLLDHVCPEETRALDWSGQVLRNAMPPNFHHGTVLGVERVGPRFLRVRVASPGTAALSAGGMHFTLILPPEGRVSAWPRIDDKGRTVWPEGADTLHRAAYTFVTLDPVAGEFTFDVFEHEGGATTTWARGLSGGERIGIMGPGGGDFPEGDHLLIAGDETALPAIRRILEHSGPARHGTAAIEVATPEDICPLATPEGIAVTWLCRSRGESLAEHLAALPLPEVTGQSFIWIAAEQAVARAARQRFRDLPGLSRTQRYISGYWGAPKPGV